MTKPEQYTNVRYDQSDLRLPDQVFPQETNAGQGSGVVGSASNNNFSTIFIQLKYTKTNLFCEIYCGYVVKTGKTTATV